MKRIILYLVLLITCIVIVDQLLGRFIENYIFAYVKSGEAGGNTNYLLKNHAALDNLILGSSRAKHQLDPDIIYPDSTSDAYNAGINGSGSILYNLILLDLWLKTHPPPKQLLLQLDVVSLSKLNPKTISHELNALNVFYNSSDLFQKYISQESIWKRLLYCSYFYRFNGKLINILYNYFKKENSKTSGFVPLQGKLRATNTILKEQHALELDTTKLQQLKDFIQFCTSRYINLKIVLCPTFYKHDYYEAETNFVVHNISSNYTQVEILDFSNLDKFPIFKNAELWKDDSHLNGEGAKHLSGLIRDSLQKTGDSL